MSGDRFQFDEGGDTFCCFVVALFTVILLPLTIFLWPSQEPRESSESLKKRCLCQRCQIKKNSLRSSFRKKVMKRFFIKSLFIIAWAFLLLLIFRISKIQVPSPSFDPFFELSIDREASQSEIRKAYKKLSLIHHPDRGGDGKKFIRISKSYAALTDETAKKNWQEYGNPDGPEAMNFGIALPKWMIQKENNLLVVGAYAIIFMFIFPLAVCLWWYNTMKFSSKKVLLITVRRFCVNFMKNPFMAQLRLLKLLSSAYEFSSEFNKDIVCRPSDNVELPPLIPNIPMLAIFKKAIVGEPYAIKALALIYAHMQRIDLPAKTLAVDKQYIITHCPRLLEEMINSLLCVLSMANEERGCPKKPIHLLSTIENCMHLVPMIVQALTATSSPLLQLPHIGPLQLRHIAYGQRNVKTIAQLARMPDEKRRLLLRDLSDDQYRDLLNVLFCLPLIEISCHCEVLDDEDPNIWPLSLVTVTVNLVRHPLLIPSSLSLGAQNVTASFVDSSTDLRCNTDASWYTGGNQTELLYNSINISRGSNLSENCYGSNFDDDALDETCDAPTKKQNASQWDKSKKRKPTKKSKTRKQYHNQQQRVPCPVAQRNKENPDPTLSFIETDEQISFQDSTLSEPVDDSFRTPPETEAVDNVVEPADDASVSSKNLDSLVTRVNREAKLRDSTKNLDSKVRSTHFVHCPFFPIDKYEGWWVYLVDRKIRKLVTKPIFVTSLQSEEELELKFLAPSLPGRYLYSLCVRSDSYVDFDFFENVPFTVVPLPAHIVQTLKDAESRVLDSSSDEDDADEYDEGDDGYEEDDYDLKEDEEEDVEVDAEEESDDKKIDIDRLTEYVARS